MVIYHEMNHLIWYYQSLCSVKQDSFWIFYWNLTLTNIIVNKCTTLSSACLQVEDFNMRKKKDKRKFCEKLFGRFKYDELFVHISASSLKMSFSSHPTINTIWTVFCIWSKFFFNTTKQRWYDKIAVLEYRLTLHYQLQFVKICRATFNYQLHLEIA